MSLEDRLQRAMAEHTAPISAPPDRWEEIEREANRRRGADARHRTRRRAAGLALGVAAAVAAALVIPGVRDRSGHRVVIHTPAAPAPATTAPPAAAGTAAPAPSPSTLPKPPTSSPGATGSGYQPLWPFAGLADADSWQSSYRAGGHQPWHLDAAQTAVSFSRDFLGYTDINAAFRTILGSKDAHVEVGFRNPNGQPLVAAVVHEVRFGSGPAAPWEVVGTDEAPGFTLTTPPYGAVVGTPTQVGGVITGVDESIKVQARQASTGPPLGVACCLAAGGTASPWHTTIAWSRATDGVLTISASTGGHLAAVERFTVTGVRTRSGPPTPGL